MALRYMLHRILKVKLLGNKKKNLKMLSNFLIRARMTKLGAGG